MSHISLPRISKWLLTLMCLFTATSCTQSYLHVRTYTYTKKDLASVKVDTPDPRKDSPYFGEKISLAWAIPLSIYNKGACTLSGTYRFYKGREIELSQPITQPVGSYTIQIPHDEYTEGGGILSYHFIIEQKTQEQAKQLLAESKHKFWVETIEVK